MVLCVQALSRNYALDEEIDETELDDELAAIDEQLQLESEVSSLSPSLHSLLLCSYCPAFLSPLLTTFLHDARQKVLTLLLAVG